MKRVASLALVGALSVGSSGCALFTPANVNVAKDIYCIIEHAWLPDTDILRLCPGTTLDEVHAGAEAHRAAVQRQGACKPVTTSSLTPRAPACVYVSGFREAYLETEAVTQ